MQAGRGMVPEARGRDLGSAAGEWVEVEADRDRAQAEEERELAAQEAVVRVRLEVCGKAARAEDRVAAQVPEAGREAEGLVPPEVREWVAVPVEVARVAEEEPVQALAEGGQARGAAQDLAAGAPLAPELAEGELDRAERERQEDG